ncbi:MAG TPA: hypothetical protein VGK48_04870 [Terriglobia bacterium]|jgi:hypothetical protein
MLRKYSILTAAMKLKIVCSISIFMLLAACGPKAGPSTAPPSGRWTGDYGPNAERRDPITLDLKWDNTTLRGTVQAGTRSLDVTQAVFKPEMSAINIQFDAQANGRTVHYVVDGKIEGNKMAGTWSHDGEQGDFQLTRQ